MIWQRISKFLTKRSVPEDAKVILTPIPKAGTHLVMKLLSLMTQPPLTGIPFLRTTQPGGVSPETLRKALIMLNPKNEYLFSHLPAKAEFLELVQEFETRIIFLYRDPRDIVISWMNWVKSQPQHHFYTYLTTIYDNDHDRIMAMITGDPNAKNHELNPSCVEFPQIDLLFKKFLPWRYQPHVYTTTYEHLVGPLGKGDALVQRREIVNIADHIGLELSTIQINTIIQSCYGGTNTFHKGKIGFWREIFSEAHKVAFKECAGQLLIELGYEKDLKW